jgi:integrin-linked kinase-associated serine/threonine phosphatase 2C
MGSKGSSVGEKNLKIAYQLSIDLKANSEEEKKRVEEKGGQVTNDKNGPYRIFSKVEDGPGLAVSRTLGDLIGHNCGVSSEPVISHKVIDSDDKFIAIGSDGVWDVMNSTEVVGYLFERGENVSKEKLPEALVNEARGRWEVINMYKQKLLAEKQKDGGRSSTTIHTIDDITCIIYFIPSNGKDKEKEEEKKENSFY